MKNNVSLRSLLTFSLSLFSAIFLFSCKKSTEPAGVNYQLQTTNRSAAISRATGTITWNSGYVMADEIKFQAKKEDLKIEYKSKAQQKVDLFSSLSPLGVVSLPPGAYKKVELKISLLPGTQTPALELKGSLGSTPIVFKVSEPYEIKTEKEAIDISASNSYTAATSLNLSLLTQGIAQSRFTNAATTNGEVVISAASNTDLYALMLENLKKLNDCDFRK